MNLSELSVGELRFEGLVEPLGLGVPAPRLSWITTAERPGWHQAAYRVEVDRAGGSQETGWVRSDESVLVAWPFATLRSRDRARVRVQVRGVDGIESAWSEGTAVEIGLLEPDQWQAAMITPEGEEDATAPQPAPLLRHGFELQGAPAGARLYVSAYGLYEIELNGQRVGDHVLTPGWTSYHHRLRYATYDVTGLLQPGANAAGALLADGWYRGNLGFSGGIRNLYGDRLGLLFQLEVTYADGTTQLVCSDGTWRASEGPIRLADLYDGETYDARREQDGWSSPGFDDAGWHGVRPLAFDPATLVAPTAPPMRRVELVAPQTITRSPSGRTIVDFGQNLVGRLRITVRGDGGEEVTLRHAEVLEDGELCTRILRKAKATDRYVLRGGGAETWEPRFTFHGFRYAEITGWPADLQASDVQAVVCHSDLERRGWFTCSEALLERLHDNVVWSVRGNTLDVPTDCPQRDERLGWTGDIQVFAPAATFLSDVGGFLVSWLADLAVEQEELQGVVPVVVPNVMGDSVPAAAAWGDAAVVVPWVLYERTGDRGVLESQFDSMCAWVDVVAERAGDRHLWEHGFQFGDWLDPTAPPDRSAAARTDPYL
ncbi:MAG: family 78 glycoside hydrolase catalytic domain, partial [Candidatus Dormiibacterota bacterium]